MRITTFYDYEAINLISNEDIRYEKGHICSTFVQMNKGATDIILTYIEINKQTLIHE